MNERLSRSDTDHANQSDAPKIGTKRYDLEDRTLRYAGDVRYFVRSIRSDKYQEDDIRQLIRASGSVGANYIEANESLGKKDFLMRIRICRKEAKESRYWLQLLDLPEENLSARNRLVQEATELMNIF